MLLRLYSFLQRLHAFKSFGSKSVIKFPYKLWNPKNISIGNSVFIAENSFLAVSTYYNTEKYTPNLKIDDNVCIGSNFFIACIDEITIEKNVLISDRVFICDHIHGYEDSRLPIASQDLKQGGKVLIKEGSFIGINAVIMPGVTIGKHAVIGASSVVTKSIPDFAVAVGNPARVIKKYNEKKKVWENV